MSKLMVIMGALRLLIFILLCSIDLSHGCFALIGLGWPNVNRFKLLVEMKLIEDFGSLAAWTFTYELKLEITRGQSCSRQRILKSVPGLFAGCAASNLSYFSIDSMQTPVWHLLQVDKYYIPYRLGKSKGMKISCY